MMNYSEATMSATLQEYFDGINAAIPTCYMLKGDSAIVPVHLLHIACKMIKRSENGMQVHTHACLSVYV